MKADLSWIRLHFMYKPKKFTRDSAPLAHIIP